MIGGMAQREWRGRRRPRVAAISYKALSRLIHSQATEYRDALDVRIVNAVFDDAVRQTQELLDKGEIDLVISAGANGEFVRDSVDVPVVLVEVSAYDIMNALRRARELAPRVALMTYGAISAEFEAVKELLNIEVAQVSYRTVEDAKEKFEQLKRDGFRVVIGASLVTELAEEAGMTPVFLYSPASIRRAFDSILDISRVRETEQARRQRLAIILRHINEGVLAVDLQGRVEVINPAMAEVLDTSAGWAVGRPLSEVAPPLLQLDETLRSGQPSLRKLEKLGPRRLLMNRVPIQQDGVQIGAVLTFQDAERIRELDRSVRSGQRSRQFVARYQLDQIIGNGASINTARESARRFASTDSTVLLLGESGTGKELFAQGTHNASSRRDGRFVALNCAAFPESLLESELFGYEEGAFSGTKRGGKVGLIESAHEGTLFLDEIGDMPLTAQTRLLRVLQEKEVLRLGSNDSVQVDVRVIAATHRDLVELVAAGEFREDLYYRLNILSLYLPPLRARMDDLEPLARTILKDIIGRHGYRLDPKQEDDLVRELLPLFRRYPWPGNVRELENILERAALFAATAPGLDLGDDDLIQSVLPELHRTTAENAPQGDDANTLHGVRRRQEQTYIDTVIERCAGNQAEAARQLGISRTTLWRKLNRF